MCIYVWHVCVYVYIYIIYSLYLWVCFMFVCLFLESTNMWDHTVFVFLWLTDFTSHYVLKVHNQYYFLVLEKKIICVWLTDIHYGVIQTAYDQENLFTFRTFEYNSSHKFSCKTFLRTMYFRNGQFTLISICWVGGS